MLSKRETAHSTIYNPKFHLCNPVPQRSTLTTSQDLKTKIDPVVWEEGASLVEGRCPGPRPRTASSRPGPSLDTPTQQAVLLKRKRVRVFVCLLMLFKEFM